MNGERSGGGVGAVEEREDETLNDLLGGKAMRGTDLSCVKGYNSGCHRRNLGRDCRDTLVPIPIDDAAIIKGVCSKCCADTWILPSGLCIRCQIKTVFDGPIYVHKSAVCRRKQPRFLNRGGIRSGPIPYGPCMGAYPCTAFANTYEVEKCAFLKRVACPHPRLDRVKFARFRVWATNFWLDLNRRTPFHFERVDRNSVIRWASKFPAKLAAETLAAFEDSEFMDPADFKVRTNGFKKGEKDVKVSAAGIDDITPRLIQAFTEREQQITRVRTAIVITQIHHWFKTAVETAYPNYKFSAGDNTLDLSSWYESRCDGTAQWGADDFTCYDSSMVREVHELVIDLYLSLGVGSDPWFEVLRRGQISPKGTTANGLCYFIDGTMRSGSADTCLANSIYNLLVHLFAFREIGGDLADFVIAIMGDDVLMSTHFRGNLGDMVAIMEDLCLMPKTQWGLAPCERVYLNMIPYPCGCTTGNSVALGTVRFAPLIGRIFARIGWSMERRDDILNYLHGIAVAFKAAVNHVPFLRVLFAWLNRVTVCKDRHFESSQSFAKEFAHHSFLDFTSDEAGKLVWNDIPPADLVEEVWSFCSQRYSLSADILKETEYWLERQLLASDSPSIVIYHPILEHLCSVDL